MKIIKNKKLIIFTKKLSIIALTGLGILLPACADSGQSSYLYRDTLDSKYKISLEELVDNPQKYMGKTVTIKEKIGEEIKTASGISTFTLEKDNWLGKDDRLLVIDRNAGLIMRPLTNNQKVKVIGEVHQFFLADFERAYHLPWDTNLRRRIVAEYEGKPVIVADSIASIQ